MTSSQIMSPLDTPQKRDITSCTRCNSKKCPNRQKFGFCIITMVNGKFTLNAGAIQNLERYEALVTEKWVLIEISLFGAPQ